MSQQEKLSVQQPPRSGEDYPFLSGGELLSPILLDMAIEHPANAKLPLRITRADNLHRSSEFGPTMRLIIQDREDAVIFDTALALYQGQHLWGSYYATYTWRTLGGQLLRFTIGSANQNGVPASLTGLNAVIDSRTYIPILPGIRQLNAYNADSLLLQVIGNDNPVRLRQGFNTTYDVADDPVRSHSGRNLAKPVTLSATPQRGLGQYQGCGDQESPFVRSLNQQQPAAAGSFLMHGDSCFRVEPVVTFNENDVATIVHGQVNLFDDCQACCDCEDYLRPYYAIQRAKRRAEPIAEQLNAIRLRYIAAKERLEQALNCLLARELRLTVTVSGECQLGISAGVFNGGVKPAYSLDLDMRILWQDVDGNWFPAEVYYIPSLGLHLSQNLSQSHIPLANLGDGQVQTHLNCVPPGEFHRVMFGVSLFQSRKVKVCLGFKNAANDQYICRDVVSNCNHEPRD